MDAHRSAIAELVDGGLLEQGDEWVRLTPRGRLLSNEVFVRFLRQSIPHGNKEVTEKH